MSNHKKLKIADEPSFSWRVDPRRKNKKRETKRETKREQKKMISFKTFKKEIKKVLFFCGAREGRFKIASLSNFIVVVEIASKFNSNSTRVFSFLTFLPVFSILIKKRKQKMKEK